MGPEMSNESKFTAAEYRTAAKVARRSIFGNPDLAKAWDQAADQVEATDSGMTLTTAQVKDVRIVLGLNGSQDIKVVLDAQERLRALFPATEPVECEFRCEEGIVRTEVGVRCPACTAAIRASEEVNGNFVAGGNSSPTVVHVHHHDIEAHAASFNEGYDEAMRQLAEPVDTIRNFARCGHYLDEARCTRRIHDGDHEVVQGDKVIVWPAGEPDPEPAEEEAEAEAVTRCPICFGLNGSHNTIHERYPTGGGGTNKPCPNSSPVVSTPSKTGPWPSIEKVPTGLVVIGTNGERFMGCPCESETHGYANQFAPFVAMKER